ncbi:Peroxisomal membrane 22 kDa family protein [Perilla frutescens var. hirtella]|nr:Peroxisomal membrane 22 kDa family protein [Perilla frutescens var. hirtella]
MAAAANSLLRHRQSLLRFPKPARSKHSLPDPPEKIGNNLAHQLQQSKWSSRFPHSISRKCKELQFSTIFSSTPQFGFVNWYLGMIKTRPVATKSVTASIIYTAADLSSQTIVGESSEGHDVVRTLRMAGYGMIIVGPSLHYWFNFISRVFPKTDLFSTFAKMALGQTVYGPIATALFFSVNAVLQGESGSEILGRLKRDLAPTLVRGVMYWPICDFITFKFVPVHLQPLVSNSFSYLWTVYLTYMAGLEKVNEVRVC